MTTIKAQKVLIFGALSYGASTINFSPSDAPIPGFFKLTNLDKDFFFPDGQITFIFYKVAPKVVQVGTVLKKITLTGEASFTGARLLPQSSWSKFGIPNVLTDQIAFIADEIIILSNKSQILSIES